MLETQKYKSNKYLIKITIPVFIETLLGMLIGNVDQLMIKSTSENAYAAIGNVHQVIEVLIMTFNVVAVASTILIAQYIGAKQQEKASQLYSLSLLVNVIFGIFVTILTVTSYNKIFDWLNYPEEIIPDSKTYLLWIGGGLILNSLSVTYSSFLRAHGYMKDCMFVSIMTNVINVFGNAMLLFGFFGLPRLGVTGVSIASNISKLVGLIVLIVLFKKRVGVKISFKTLIPFPFKQLKKMLSIGVPSAGENLSFALVTVVIQKFINVFGKGVVTARVTVNLLTFISWIFALSISLTTQVIIGYLMGARDIEGANQRFKTSTRMSMLLSFCGSLILLFFCKPICGIFVDDPEILKICQQVMIVEIFLEQGRAVNLCAVRSLQACGDTKFPIYTGIIVAWIVAVGGGYVLGIVFNLGIIGVWTAMACDEIIRAIIFVIRWKRGKWRNMTLIDNRQPAL